MKNMLKIWLEDPKKKKILLLILIFLLLIIMLAVGLLWRKEGAVKAVLTVETPQKVSLSDSKELSLDVTVSNLGETFYPAMSASISFDPSRLEFLGLGEGNVFVHDDSNSSGQKLPEWSCNIEKSNESGFINLMYLDMSGGKYAFDQQLLEEEDNVVFRLNFRLKGSIRKGDVCELIVEDAVFAASDEAQSLAVTTGTLKTKNAKIVIGE